MTGPFESEIEITFAWRVMDIMNAMLDIEFSGLCLVNAYIDAHCNFKPDLKRQDLPLPHIMLSDHQALAVSWEGYELMEETSARQINDISEQPIMGVDVYKSK